MTENPLYRRVYNSDNPLLQQPRWRPPSEAYPQMNYNQNAAQDLRNLLGNFFAQNAAQNYSPQYRTPYSATPYQLHSTQIPTLTPEQQTAQQIYKDGADAAANFVTDQLIQNALMTAGIGTGAGTVLGISGRAAAPYVLATLGAHRLTKPIANGLIKFGDTTAGKTLGKYADKVIDWLW